ncbi:MAG: polyphosphate polymerase domain-containing protein [Lachnospiraceae bacterium]|nr:polyphosphate polymerase domain-containing protein [Lachnospiraceae bacterium]
MAPIEVFSRVEHKYIIDSAVYKNIRNQLKDYMYEDGFSTDGGFYTICNIYYDTATDELIRKSLEKPVYKEKLRLRSYGRADDDTKVFLEIKKKFKGVVNKRRTVLKLKEAYDFTETYRQPEYRDYMNKQVLNELEYFMNHYKPVPKVFLAYDRAALFCKDDPELRITFDTNIRTRRDNLRLDLDDNGELLIDKGQWLMEIKVINAYPLWLVDILNSNGLFKTSFSKYGTEYLKNKLI